MANPNVCLHTSGRAQTECGCDFLGCEACAEEAFVCAACKDLFLIDRLELDYLLDEEKSLMERLERIKERQQSIATCLRR